MRSAASRRPAVFFDRDGTLITFLEVLDDPARVRLLPHARETIVALQARGFLSIVITNQPNIERGIFTVATNDLIHAEINRQLAMRDDRNAQITAFYTCPHQYRSPDDPVSQCACRKPGIALVEDAMCDFNIDLAGSWFVGDRLRDIATGRRAGVKTILVTPSTVTDQDDSFFPDIHPDFVVRNLAEVAAVILT